MSCCYKQSVSTVSGTENHMEHRRRERCIQRKHHVTFLYVLLPCSPFKVLLTLCEMLSPPLSTLFQLFAYFDYDLRKAKVNT
jgi:hypothetical protein